MKFFNSDKSGFLSFVAKRMKALFALLFIIAGTSSVWGQSFYVAGNGDGSRGIWCDGQDWNASSSLMTQQGNIYVKQFANLPANDDYQFKIVKDGNWDNGSWGFSNYQSSSDNTNFISGSVSCSDAGGNIKFSLSQTANVTVAFDFTNKHVAVYSSSVEIGLVGSFTDNWNLEQQIKATTDDGVTYTWDLSYSDISLNDSDEFKFISGTTWDNNTNQWGGPLGGAYTIPASASTDGTIYNVDIIVHHKDCGKVKFDAPLCPVTIQKIELNVLTNDLKITTGESSTEPEPVTPTADSYVVTWAEPVYDAEAGTVVLSATVAAAENAGFALADETFEAQINVVGLASSARTILSESNQYTISHTISGVAANQQIDYSLQIVTGGGNPLVNPSDVPNLNPQTYTVPEAEPEPEPVSLYLIGAGTGAQWILADALPFTYENGVYTWTGELTVNNEAFKILTSNTGWEPAYVAETNQFEVVLEEAIVLHYREKTGDNQYTWGDNKFKITEDGEYTIKVTLGGDNSGSMIVTKKSDPVYAATITADASVAEQVSLASTLTETAAGTNLATATCVFQYKAADAGDEPYADMSETASVIYSGEGATRTATLSQSMAADSYVFRAVWTYNSTEVANAVTETVTIPSDTPTPTDIDFYVRGEKIGCTPSESGNCWGVASEEFKATSKEGNVYVWGWTTEPKLMVGPFKIADANFSDANNYGLDNKTTINLTDGKWTGTLQVNTASGDMEISEPGWNVSKITFDYDTKILEIFATPVFKDIWFRSSIVENGWGDDISDPIGSGVSPKYQGQTTDGKVYTWDWRGSKAVTLESSTEFKFGEYKGTSWAASGYAPNGQASVTSADFGKEISVQVAAGNFSAGEKITITKITLDTETLKLVLEGEQYKERFPVTVNTVNGEVGGSVVTDPVDIGALAIGETVTVTATANEGYVALFEATSGCVMKDGSADNIKVFEITEANPVITVTFQVQCETVKPGFFTISGQFNAEILDADGLYQGSPVVSGKAETVVGYWSDGARYIQLTANSVTANYFDWECTGYAIDGVAQEAVPEISWTDKDKTSARADLSLPGTYTFVCKAKCNETDEWTNSAELTITAPAPEMGFNGNIVTNHDWGNPEWAGQADGGYMTRRSGSLTWVSNPFTVDGFGTGNTDYHFVIDQRYKFLGCVKQNGWTENNECNDLPGDGNNKDNKINRSNLTFKNVAWDGEQGANFAAINPGAWVANETQLQLTVTMTDWDSYTVALEEVSQECTTPADNFPISAQLNKGAGALFEGNLVVSGSSTKTGGYFADDFRTVTLTTTQVADTYEWKLVGYAIDGNAQATADLTTLATITNGDAQTATALLSLPGDYTFQCTAACTDGTPVNSATVTISTYPEMGFDGPIGTPASVSENGWNHAWAGTDGLMNRAQGSLTWSKTFIYQNQEGLSDQNCFVVIQRYKLGCIAEASQGWAGFDECGGIDGNKINKQDVEMSGVHLVDPGTLNYNFAADDVSAWTPGVTELTLTVTMRDWDSYTVELAKKQEQIEANYSSNDDTMGTVTMKVGDTPIANGADITAYIGQIVTLTATPASGYKVASWEINDKVTESDRTTISPTLSGAGLNVVVTFERDCYAGVAYDLTGGGVICADGGSTELSLNTLNNVTYQLYKGGAVYDKAAPVQGNGEAAKWTISEEGTYTAKAYDSRFVEECQEHAIDMNGSAVVTSVPALEITVNPGVNVHLTVLQARSFTADVPVDWSITDVSSEGGYCTGDGYMISSQTDTSLVAKFLCIGTAKITATMKAPNQNCKAEVTVHQNGAEMENCAPEPEDMQ